MLSGPELVNVGWYYHGSTDVSIITISLQSINCVKCAQLVSGKSGGEDEQQANNNGNSFIHK